VTDFLAAVRTIIFVVINAPHNIGGPHKTTRSPMVGARRSWKMADFPRAAIGRTIFFSVPRGALRPIRLSRSFALFTFRSFRTIIFFHLSVL